MRIHSYTVVHYGLDYIGYALRSILPHVDVAHVFYTPHPSHGHVIPDSPPEYSIQIYEAAKQFDHNNKMRWYQSANIFYEGQQRDMAVKTCQNAGADIVLVCDVDEVWHSHVLTAALELVKVNEPKARNWLINFTHLWRSFNWACRDNNWPVRFIDLRYGDGTAYIPKELGDIYHFGYAVTDKVMSYKWRIHGHRDELRANWLDEKWFGWQPGVEDVHPTNERGWWKPQPFDRTELPEFMQVHPFYNKDRIE